MLTTLQFLDGFCLCWLFLGLSKTVPNSPLWRRRDHFAHSQRRPGRAWLLIYFLILPPNDEWTAHDSMRRAAGHDQPFSWLHLNNERRQGQMGRVHKLDGSWHKKVHWPVPLPRVWRENRILTPHCSSDIRIHLRKHWQNTLKVSLQLLHIQMVKYSGDQFILLTQGVETILILLANNTDVNVTVCHRISFSFFNNKLAVTNQEFKNKVFICKSCLTLLWLHKNN